MQQTNKSSVVIHEREIKEVNSLFDEVMAKVIWRVDVKLIYITPARSLSWSMIAQILNEDVKKREFENNIYKSISRNVRRNYAICTLLKCMSISSF